MSTTRPGAGTASDFGRIARLIDSFVTRAGRIVTRAFNKDLGAGFDLSVTDFIDG